jgi:hypothetical protein
MEKKEYDHFIGLWRHPKGGFEIKFQQGGKKQSEYRKDEKEARLRADYWKAVLGAPHESDSDHPVYYWERMLRNAAELLLKHPRNKDVAAACRSIASMATAAMRTCKYIAAPVEQSPDAAPVSGDISNLSSEEIEGIVGNDKAA